MQPRQSCHSFPVRATTTLTGMTSDLTALVVLTVLLVLAVTAPLFGADSRTSREWSEDGPLPRPAPRR